MRRLMALLALLSVVSTAGAREVFQRTMKLQRLSPAEALRLIDEKIPIPTQLRVGVDVDSRTLVLSGPQQTVLKACIFLQNAETPPNRTAIKIEVLEPSPAAAAQLRALMPAPVCLVEPGLERRLRPLRRKALAPIPDLLAPDGEEAKLHVSDKIVVSGGSSKPQQLQTGYEAAFQVQTRKDGQRTIAVRATAALDDPASPPYAGVLTVKEGQTFLVDLRRSAKAKTAAVPRFLVCTPVALEP